jgi:hypothetical protein
MDPSDQQQILVFYQAMEAMSSEDDALSSFV